MPTIDQWGCPVTASPDEVSLIEGSVVDYLTMTPAIAERLPALAEGGPLARSLFSMLLTQSHRPALVKQAREVMAEVGSKTWTITARERHNVEAATAWANGHTDRTIDAFDMALADNPTDLFALRARYLLLFSVGRLEEMAEAVPAVRSAWSDDLVMASYLDGMEAFALEENGQYSRAEELGRQGVERDPSDLWAIHSVAHVLEMQERRTDGVDWLDSNEPVMGGGGFAGHLWWHRALQLWALGRNDDALASFDAGVYPGASEEGLDLSNAVSLLTRLESSGVDVGDRWARLADPATVRFGQHSHPFNDTHFVLALARSGRIGDAERLVEELRSWSTGDDNAAAVLRQVGVPVAEGLLAFGTAAWKRAVGHLEPVMDEVWRLGGSHAQRFFYSIVFDTANARAGATG